jgi:multidrug efflux pump subunit AcrA (membrane-fusion protein)
MADTTKPTVKELEDSIAKSKKMAEEAKAAADVKRAQLEAQKKDFNDKKAQVEAYKGRAEARRQNVLQRKRAGRSLLGAGGVGVQAMESEAPITLSGLLGKDDPLKAPKKQSAAQLRARQGRSLLGGA